MNHIHMSHILECHTFAQNPPKIFHLTESVSQISCHDSQSFTSSCLSLSLWYHVLPSLPLIHYPPASLVSYIPSSRRQRAWNSCISLAFKGLLPEKSRTKKYIYISPSDDERWQEACLFCPRLIKKVKSPLKS